MSYEAVPFEKICRTCLCETSETKSVFSGEESTGETCSLLQMLTSCAFIQDVADDGLPTKVCLQCVHHITRAFYFKQLCERSENTLRELLNRSTLVELKPILTDESCINPMSDIITDADPDNYGYCVEAKHLNNDLVESQSEHLGNISSIENIDLKVSHNTEGIKILSCEVQSFDELDTNDGQTQEQIDDFNFEKHNKEVQKNTTVDETEQPIFPCDDCTLCFTSQADLKTHMKDHVKSSRYSCKVCNQVFSSASTLCRHVKVHEVVKRHLCSDCGKGFTRSDDLTRHLRTHTGEKPFACKLCDKAFAQSFRLLEHMRAHANEKSFVCDLCGKAFSRSTSLSAHAKTHSGIKTHTCSVCGKKLCGPGSLTMHMKTHTGLKDHICPYCEKGFTTPSNLLIHKRIHTGERPYVCTTCGKGFPDPSRLTVHSRIHTGVKPYICPTCNRGCVSSSQLKKHMRIHTGERPYQCPMCPKAFPRSEDLRIHIKTHTVKTKFCIVCGQPRTDSRHLFGIPKDETVRKQWILALGKHLPPNGFLCSDHFAEECLGALRLRLGSLPSKQ